MTTPTTADNQSAGLDETTTTTILASSLGTTTATTIAPTTIGVGTPTPASLVGTTTTIVATTAPPATSTIETNSIAATTTTITTATAASTVVTAKTTTATTTLLSKVIPATTTTTATTISSSLTDITTPSTSQEGDESNPNPSLGVTSHEDTKTITNNSDNKEANHFNDVENKSKLFSNVKFLISAQSDNVDAVRKALVDRGGTLINYLSDIVTHVIADNDSTEDKLVGEAIDIFEKPVVRSKWVWMCLRTNRLLPLCAFSPLKQIFAPVVACFGEDISQNDAKKLSAILTYNGGIVQKNFDINKDFSLCTHLIVASASGDIFKQATKSRRLKIVTPDWIIDSSKNKTLCDEEIYNPIHLEYPSPPKPQPTPPPPPQTQKPPEQLSTQNKQLNSNQVSTLPNQPNHSNAIAVQPRQKYPPIVHFQNRNPNSLSEQRAPQIVSMNNCNRPQVYYQQQQAQIRNAQSQPKRHQFRSENPINVAQNHDLMNPVPYQNQPQEIQQQSSQMAGLHNNPHHNRSPINNLLDSSHVQQSHEDSSPQHQQQQHKMRMLQPVRSHLQHDCRPGFGPNSVNNRQSAPQGMVTMSQSMQPMQRVSMHRPAINDLHMVRQPVSNNFDNWRRPGPDQLIDNHQQRMPQPHNVRMRHPHQFGSQVALNNQQQVRQVNQQNQDMVQIVSGINRVQGTNQQIVHLQPRNQYHLSNSHPQNSPTITQMNRPQVFFQQPQQQGPNSQVRMQHNQINMGRPMLDQPSIAGPRMIGVDDIHIHQQVSPQRNQQMSNMVNNHQPSELIQHQPRPRAPINQNIVDTRQVNRHPSSTQLSFPNQTQHSVTMQQPQHQLQQHQQQHQQQQHPHQLHQHQQHQHQQHQHPQQQQQHQHPSIFNDAQDSLSVRLNPSCVPKMEQIAAYVGHETPEEIPATHQLLGCTFMFSEHENTSKDCLNHWFAIIKQNGGKITELLSDCTHLICETRSTDTYKQAFREGKRCVTIYWVNDVIAQRKLDSPWKAVHIPLPYTKDNAPCKNHIISLTNFEGKERVDLREMILRSGARYTDYLSPKNTTLICHSVGGQKYKKAMHWKISIVNAQWLTDVLLGYIDPSSLVLPRYQIFKAEKPFKISSYISVQDIMSPWLNPIKVTKEEIESVSKLPCIKLETSCNLRRDSLEEIPPNKTNGMIKLDNEDGVSEVPDKQNEQNLIKQEGVVKNEGCVKQGSESSSNPPADRCNNSNSSASNLASASSVTNHIGTATNQRQLTLTPKSPSSRYQNNIFITFTQIGANRLEELKNQASKLGAKVVEDPVKCTHLVTDRVCRTTTFICAYNYARYILKSNWLTESYRANMLLDEKDFLLHDKENEDRFCFNMKQSLRRRARREAQHASISKQNPSSSLRPILDLEDKSRKCLLFKDLVFFVTPGVKPAPSILKPMIESAGGQVVLKKPPSRIQFEQLKLADKQLVVISCENDYHLCENLVSYGARIEQTEFVMSGILRQEIDFDTFKLTHNSTIPPDLKNNMITIRPPPSQPPAHKKIRLEESTSC